MSKIQRFLKTGGVLAFAGAAAITAVALTGAKPLAMNDLSEVRLGTYEPQQAFNMYHAAEDIQRRSEELQQRMQQAQEQQDQQAMMQIQQEFQQLQMEQDQIIQQFFTDVEQAVPEVAEEQGVHVVAVEIVHVSDEIGEPEDLTHELMEHINEQPRETPQREQPPQPDDLPW